MWHNACASKILLFHSLVLFVVPLPSDTEVCCPSPSVSDAITDIQKADVEELAGDLAESVTHVAEDVGEIVTNVFVEEIDFEVLSVYMATQGHPEEEKKTEDVVNVEEAVKVKSSETK